MQPLHPRVVQSRPCRPFSILDGMVLVAATAVGIVLARSIFEDAVRMPSSPMWLARPITFFCLPWTLAFVNIRLHAPRRSLHRIMVQPGMAACTAVAVVTAIDIASWVIYWTTLDSQHARDMLARYWRGHSHHAGLAVVATWLGLRLGRYWRPEPGWIDRLGWVLGLIWVLTLLCDWRFGRWTFDAIHLLRSGLR